MNCRSEYLRVRVARASLRPTVTTGLGHRGLFPVWLWPVLAIAIAQPPPALSAAPARGGGPVTATAISEHFLEVRFAGQADPEWSSAAAYRIIAADGSPLAVEAVEMGPDGDTAVLTTGAQRAVEYRLALADGLTAARTTRRCQARQLRAAGTLCRAEMRCWSRFVRGGRGSDPTRRDRCIRAARARFASAQAKAVPEARRKGGACELDGQASEFVDGLLLEPMARLRDDAFVSGWD